MNLTVTAIAIALFLLPGVGSIGGIHRTAGHGKTNIITANNLGDLSLALVCALIIHAVFTAAFPIFSIASIVEQATKLTENSSNPIGAQLNVIRELQLKGSAYIVLTSVLAFVAGMKLGDADRRGQIKLFAKPAWMEELSSSRSQAVYALVVLSPNFSQPASRGSGAIVIQGFLSDISVTSDGTMKYLVFFAYQESVAHLGVLPTLSYEVASQLAGSTSHGTGRRESLVIEGRWVAMARYEILSMAALANEKGLEALRQAVAEDKM